MIYRKSFVVSWSKLGSSLTNLKKSAGRSGRRTTRFLCSFHFCQRLLHAIAFPTTKRDNGINPSPRSTYPCGCTFPKVSIVIPASFLHSCRRHLISFGKRSKKDVPWQIGRFLIPVENIGCLNSLRPAHHGDHVVIYVVIYVVLTSQDYGYSGRRNRWTNI